MEKIQARVILEILGRPPEHITSSLGALIDRMAKEQGVKILDKKMHEPIEVKDSKDLYTTFAEILAELDSFEIFIGIMFAYMPANIEIISPEKVVFTNTSFNFLSGRLLTRLHEYDAIAKKMIMDRDFLVNKLKEVAPDLFKENPPETKIEGVRPKKSPRKSPKKKSKK